MSEYPLIPHRPDAPASITTASASLERFVFSLRTAATAAAIALSLSPIFANAEVPRLYTNQEMVEDVTKSTTLAIDDPMAVFTFVLNSLGDNVTVYPTENYYYFWFYHNSTRYAGNIRIDVLDRDAGYLHFAYFKDMNEWSEEPDMKYLRLGKSNGVTVEKVETLLYRVTFGPKSATFKLNDLSKVTPPASLMGAEEKFLGPVFDESAIRFFLIYNTRLKAFHYILDETVTVADELSRSQIADRILIGRRTGFAFYRDHHLDRKILIGVFEGNSRSNNYFDGPFDQLPDNFIQGESLRSAILAVEPELRGKIDRFGIAPDAASRYAIGPYLHYRNEEDLEIFHECATSKQIPASDYYNCFVIADREAAEASPSPPPTRKARPKRMKK